MATFCSQCGGELPHNDARFCNHCGAVQTDRLAKSPSFVSANNNLSSGMTPTQDAPPKDLREQEEKPEEALARNALSERPTPSEPPIQTTVMERPNQVDASAGSEQLDFPDLPSTPQPLSPALRVKVWNEADPAHSLHGLEEAVKLTSPENKRPEDRQGDGAVEDLPTRLMESISSSSQTGFVVDDMPTTPLLTSPPGERLQSIAGQNRNSLQQPERPSANIPDVAHLNTVHLQAQPQSPRADFVPIRSDRPIEHLPLPGTIRGKKRLPLVVGSAAIFLLLIVALGSWILLLQPFRVSPVTDTQQSFTDAKLGVELRYPNGWKPPQVDYKKQTILLQDGSDTAQMNVNITNASVTESPQSYVQKQAAQLGISNPKSGASSSFANSSWQNIQGDAQVKGAQYTYGLFTTLHNKHLYTLTQMAPSSTYADEEKLVFSPSRLSFHFL